MSSVLRKILGKFVVLRNLLFFFSSVAKSVISHMKTSLILTCRIIEMSEFQTQYFPCISLRNLFAQLDLKKPFCVSMELLKEPLDMDLDSFFLFVKLKEFLLIRNSDLYHNKRSIAATHSLCQNNKNVFKMKVWKLDVKHILLRVLKILKIDLKCKSFSIIPYSVYA